MKRGIAGGTRRGAPPVGRQRVGLRVTQITLAGVAAYLALLVLRSWDSFSAGDTGLGEIISLAAGGGLFLGLALSMGIRTVRGPEPPKLHE